MRLVNKRFLTPHEVADRLRIRRLTGGTQTFSQEDLTWLETDVGGPLPPFHWGSKGVPSIKPVRYVPGVGLVFEEVDDKGGEY